ncbi:MAG TPA: hypothetical protein GXX28_07570 [Firmicutes bacterium]|nr:hypothetical protein [Bacillota bacterium]
MYRVDLHTHPTSHKYYFGRRTGITLDAEDRRRVESFIHWAIGRGLDALGITDHHYLAAGWYVREYAEEHGLPIQVLPGVELEPKQLGFLRSVHLLAFNIREDIPKLLGVRETLDAIHEQGGVAIMAHPVFCPDEFWRVADRLDGVEVWNVLSAAGGIGFLQKRLWKAISCTLPDLPQFRGSDCHHPRVTFPLVHTEIDGEWLVRLGGWVEAAPPARVAHSA